MIITNRRLIRTTGPEFYPTPAWATQALINLVRFNGTIFEPCCGDGAMARILKAAHYKVVASDIKRRGYGRQKDFLTVTNRFDNIVTNPPFNIAEPLLLHALKIARRKVAFLLRVAFLESIRRFENIFSVNPPSQVLVFSERLSLYPKGRAVKGSGTTSYAWFIWNKRDRTGETKVRWIAPGAKHVMEAWR